MRKLLIVGHARHGKDTAAEYLAKALGVTYTASSEICAELLFGLLAPKYGYTTVKQCFDDRSNHRAEWHECIKDYNSVDRAALAELIYRDHTIYCGIREVSEFRAILGRFNPIVVWVDASDRLPLEDVSSMNIEFEDCPMHSTVIVENNGTEEEYLSNLAHAFNHSLFSDARWLARQANLAKEAASWSKDPDCKVGAAIIAPDLRSFHLGYNGFPCGIDDSIDRLRNKGVKNMYTVHAELNALLNARADVSGFTLVVTKPICTGCAGAIIQAGISTVIQPQLERSSSWYADNLTALDLLKEAKIDIIQDDVAKINSPEY